MAKIIAATRCHYGKDYLAEVVRSTEGFASEHVVMYTPTPTFGRDTDIACPDSRDELREAAFYGGGIERSTELR